MDAGREWIEAQAAEWPDLAAALEDDKLMKAARRTTKYWNRAWEQRVTELRASPALRHQMTRSHVHRTAIGVTRALVANVRASCAARHPCSSHTQPARLTERDFPHILERVRLGMMWCRCLQPLTHTLLPAGPWMVCSAGRCS